jgi:hypothetical protein
MRRFEGSLARKLDFGEITVTGVQAGNLRGWLRLAAARRADHLNPEKYRLLDHRRRQAQIRARRALDLR